MKKIVLSFSLGAVVMLLNACAKMNFQPTSSSIESSEEITANPPKPKEIVCEPTEKIVNRTTRVLFLVDQSGSNLNGPYEFPGAATDPQKKFRTKIIDEFHLLHQNKKHISWNLSVFQKNTAQSLVNNSEIEGFPFSPVTIDFQNAIASFKERKDQGETPYRAALTLAGQMIAKDLLIAPEDVQYLVVLMTDGYPTDYCPGGLGEVLCPGKILEQELFHDVRVLLQLNPGNVQLSTVYYGKADSEAANRLKAMSELGSGEFVDTNITTEVKLNDLLKVEVPVCVEK